MATGTEETTPFATIPIGLVLQETGETDIEEVTSLVIRSKGSQEFEEACAKRLGQSGRLKVTVISLPTYRVCPHVSCLIFLNVDACTTSPLPTVTITNHTDNLPFRESIQRAEALSLFFRISC